MAAQAQSVSIMSDTELTREQCVAILKWRDADRYTDEQLRCAVRNAETRERAMRGSGHERG
jgi:hypothetical protein